MVKGKTFPMYLLSPQNWELSRTNDTVFAFFCWTLNGLYLLWWVFNFCQRFVTSTSLSCFFLFIIFWTRPLLCIRTLRDFMKVMYGVLEDVRWQVLTTTYGYFYSPKALYIANGILPRLLTWNNKRKYRKERSSVPPLNEMFIYIQLFARRYCVKIFP